MALVKRQSNSQRMLIIFLVVVVVGGVAYFLITQYFNSSNGGTTTTNVSSGRPVITNFGEGILNDSRYTGLQTYGTNISVNANQDAGQSQPFR